MKRIMGLPALAKFLKEPQPSTCKAELIWRRDASDQTHSLDSPTRQ